MMALIGSIAAAAAASACCLGPVLLPLLGAGALGAAATQLEPLRPLFLLASAGLLAAAFGQAARHQTCTPGGSCPPATQARNRRRLWSAAVLVALLAAVPYYIEKMLY